MAAALAAVASDWTPVGISQSSLRIFVQRSSIRQAGALRMARVRIGWAKAFVRSIDLVYQDDEIDCSARTWRLLGSPATHLHLLSDRLWGQSRLAGSSMVTVESALSALGRKRRLPRGPNLKACSPDHPLGQ